MPAQRPQVRRSEQIKARIKTTKMATQRPPRGSRGGGITRGTRGRGGGGAIVSNTIQQLSTAVTTNYMATPAATPTTATPATATPTTTAGRVTVRWETCDFDHTDTLIQFLETHPGACHVLFNESKKSCNPTITEPETLGSQKSHIWATIAQTIFAEDEEYENVYAQDNHKFALAVSNHLNYLRNKYKKHCARFLQTSAGINPLDATEQVLADFPWFNAPDALWKGNPVFVPKTILSAPGVDHASGMAALTQGKGKGKEIAPPPPDPYDTVGDTEGDLMNNVTDLPPLTQGKGKEKALPLPSPDEFMDETPSPNNIDCSSHIPQVNPPLPHTLSNDANDDMDVQQWDNVGDDNFELAEQGDDHAIQICISNKHPYPSPSPPPTYTPCTPKFPSCRKFQTHTDCALNRGTIRTPKPPSSLLSLSLLVSSSHSCSHTSTSPSSSARRPAASQKSSSLLKCVDSNMQDVQGQVQSLADGMNYIYTVKAAASEYKIVKAEIECDEAAAIHQHLQEAKALELQLLEAQAKVQMEKQAALQLEIKLLKLKGGAASA
ncbi:uncharacterized protein BJ212DRAFT_1487189 [Suillus subaureus]|uniref:Uncharacterized protein n=1 Tax=Suillus subaureus TaxID=48587 RepID=A0A9P7J584_9AGAM|nr:uncharacterized protein BJ212DRAFT_1487189 [Suillus subaureus]KAG1803075.1 hypothetical protein BJ212DRAFT_1487189 [Suillus subaureus]